MVYYKSSIELIEKEEKEARKTRRRGIEMISGGIISGFGGASLGL
jgi:hypothetical protein